MPRTDLTVAEAIHAARMIDETLSAFERTAPRAVAAMGGRDQLTRRLSMPSLALAPVPALTEQEFEAMCEEYEDNRQHGRTMNRGEATGA